VNFKLEGKTVFRSSNDSRTRNRYPASRPSRHINSLAGHTSPLAGRRAPFHLRHDDCLKKGAPHCFEISPFFLSSLFLSLRRGREKGHFEGALRSKRNGPRALLLIRGSKVAPRGVRRPPQSTRAPSPPTDQGFEGCAPWGSATTPEHSGSEPFTDQGFKSWPLEGIRQPPQNMQNQG
jgi:hypothetical protein